MTVPEAIRCVHQRLTRNQLLCTGIVVTAALGVIAVASLALAGLSTTLAVITGILLMAGFVYVGGIL